MITLEEFVDKVRAQFTPETVAYVNGDIELTITGQMLTTDMARENLNWLEFMILHMGMHLFSAAERWQDDFWCDTVKIRVYVRPNTQLLLW